MLSKYWGERLLKELIQTYLTARHEYLRSGQPIPIRSHASSEIVRLLDECITRSNGPDIPRTRIDPHIDPHIDFRLREAFQGKQAEWRANRDRILALWSGPPLASRISAPPIPPTAHTGPGRAEERNPGHTTGPGAPRNNSATTTCMSYPKTQFFIKGQAERTQANSGNLPPTSQVSPPLQSPANLPKVKREIDNTEHGIRASDNSARFSRPSSSRPSLPGPNDEVVVISDDGSDSDNSDRSYASPGSSSPHSASRKRPAPFYFDPSPSKRRANGEVSGQASVYPDSYPAIAPVVGADHIDSEQSAVSDANAVTPDTLAPPVSRAPDEMQDNHVTDLSNSVLQNATSKGANEQKSPPIINGLISSTTIPIDNTNKESIDENRNATTTVDADEMEETTDTNATVPTGKPWGNYMIAEMDKESSGHLGSFESTLSETSKITSPLGRPFSPSAHPSPSPDHKSEHFESSGPAKEPNHIEKLHEGDVSEPQTLIKELQRRLHDEQQRADTMEMQIKGIQGILDHREQHLIERPPIMPTPKAQVSPHSTHAHLEYLEYLKEKDTKICMGGVGDEIAKLQKIVLMKLSQEEDKNTDLWSKMERLWLTLDTAVDEAKEAAAINT
ncbi:hypothetical protein F4779DRAFT_597326 [Xylariaceae sp. FL0662B]|nr:hypothetical protein F4779DRAFT_597326 [Xylariaceae sp. FL0662B]